MQDKNLIDVNLTSEMKTSFIDYAMSVIVARALPDVRDGLKPVHRRILYGMNELGVTPDKPHKKSARITGDVMGKYHPHGDSSIYEAMVRMAQWWSYRHMLVDGHGNFGSMDGDGAAAQRYTEARMSKIALEMLRDINKNTVDFQDNYDGSEREPLVLPARFPNLLVNGATGIAVGMATNIPPHNLGESIDAVKLVMDNPDVTTRELMEVLPGPDFPTGALVMGKSGIRKAYETGKGSIVLRSRTEIETTKSGRERIVVTEFPYGVNKTKVHEHIVRLAQEKRIEGITAVRDESSREGMRVVIELRKDVNANVILNQLYKHTQLQDTFGVIMLALVNNEPKVLNLLDMLTYYIRHQEEVVTRRTKFDLNKAEERDHILQGLLIALDNIDEVIQIIRSSSNTQTAKEALIARFDLSDAQAQAIVDMRLRALTGLEREKLENEHKELLEKIAYLKSILADEKILLGVIKDEINLIADKFGDDRRSKIGYDEYDISMEDLIPRGNTVIAMTSLGYIKRMTVDNFKVQHRGGRGIKGMQTIEDDVIENLLMTDTHNYIMFFTSLGRVYQMKAYQIPEAGRTARGTAIINLLQLNPGEKISAVIPISEEDYSKNVLMVTKKGIIKKTTLEDYKNMRKSGLIAMNIREDDELIEVKTTTADNIIYLVTKKGMCICFKETDVRITGRNTMGVIGMNLNKDDEIVGMQLDTQGEKMLVVSEKGYGKKTPLSEFHIQKRGGKGIRCYKIVEKSGDVVGMKAVNDDHEIMMITDAGIIIQISMNDVSTYGRNASGVKLMNLDDNVKIAKVAKVREKFGDEADEIDELDEIMEEDADTSSTEETQSETE